MLDNNIWKHWTMCKRMSSDSFKNFTYKLFVCKSYIYKQELALNNPQGLICPKMHYKIKL